MPSWLEPVGTAPNCIAPPTFHRHPLREYGEVDVRCGSLADMAISQRDVRLTRGQARRASMPRAFGHTGWPVRQPECPLCAVFAQAARSTSIIKSRVIGTTSRLVESSN